jgi:hypothetical protein
MADTEQSIFKRYERVVADLATSIEVIRLPADGEEPTRENVRGLTIPPTGAHRVALMQFASNSTR